MPRNNFGEIRIPDDRIATWRRRFPDSFEPSGAQLTFAIRALAQRINDHANEWLAPYGLTAKKFNYLATICSNEGEGMTILELGALVHTSSGTVTTMINALERDGLVRRSVNRDDGRSVRIQATKKGHRAIEEAWSVHHRNIEDMVVDLSLEERAALLDTLIALGEKLTDREATS
ncbi:MAG TPA: MarR family transcriptional regulator [Candidatus Lustribacter sp.]|jgi:DNA-binding MarR family transcriptional regulator|nr:MarR family transcriptional regulator [Candidatus Lustribacter sp.]